MAWMKNAGEPPSSQSSFPDELPNPAELLPLPPDDPRVPQSAQSVPYAQSSDPEPGPPSLQKPSDAYDGYQPVQVLVHCALPPDDGDGDGGGGEGPLLPLPPDDPRVPQSAQSVPYAQSSYSEPGPPSSHMPSLANEGLPVQVSRHCEAMGLAIPSNVITTTRPARKVDEPLEECWQASIEHGRPAPRKRVGFRHISLSIGDARTADANARAEDAGARAAVFRGRAYRARRSARTRPRRVAGACVPSWRGGLLVTDANAVPLWYPKLWVT